MIRLILEKDIEKILELEQIRFTTDCWNKEQWLSELNDNPFATTLVLEENDELIGYINYWITFEQATINKICILTNKEKLGYGSVLLKETLKRIDEALCISTTLEVRVSNEKAIRLYTKHDFNTILTKPHYYDDGEDAYYMIRYIGGVNNER